MILSISKQVEIFFLSILTGIFLGFFYDLIRFLRRIIKHSMLFIQIQDFLYWLIVSIIVFLVLLYKNNGEIRVFFILGMFTSMIFYFFTISAFIIKILLRLYFILQKIILNLCKIIYKPLKLFIHFILIPLKNIKNKINIHVKCKKTLEKVKKMCQNRK